MIRKFTLLLFILFSACGALSAQKQNNIWYFGNYAGLNFNTGTPVALTNGAMSTTEGCSSIADTAGNPLFYTDGSTIWNRNNVPMANGTGLTGNYSSTQSALIVRLPGSDSLYYVFVTWTNLSYSIVDISLNGGLGGVIAGSKNIVLASDAGEKICGTPHADGSDIWIMSHEYTTNGFNAFLLSATGLGAEVHSNSGLANANNGAPGQMKFDCKGDKIAYGIPDNSSGLNYSITVSNFDNSTGIVSGSYAIQTTPNQQTYGIEFSPSGQYLYGSINNAVTQYNLNAGSPAAVQASRDTVAVIDSFSFLGLQLGPDDKIYICSAGRGSLSAITAPNQAGAASNFSINAVYLGGKSSEFDLPSIVDYKCALPEALAVTGTQVNISCYDSCNGSAAVNISSGNPPYHILWWPGGDTTVAITNLCAGAYTVRVTDQSGASFADTLIITSAPRRVVNITAASPVICHHDSVKISATPGFSFYTWTVAGNDSFIEAQLAGNYIVTATDSLGCKVQSNQVSIIADTVPPIIVTASKNPFCSGDSVLICATQGFTTYNWGGSGSGTCFYTFDANTYRVTVTDANGCTAVSNSVNVTTYAPTPVTISVDGDTLKSYTAQAYAWYYNNQLLSGDTGSSIIAAHSGFYAVEVTDSNGCRYTSSVTEVATAINNLANSYVKLYPNPNNGRFTVAFADNIQREIEVTDALGRLLIKTTKAEQQTLFDSGNLATGIYFLQIVQNDHAESLKFTVVN